MTTPDEARDRLNDALAAAGITQRAFLTHRGERVTLTLSPAAAETLAAHVVPAGLPARLRAAAAPAVSAVTVAEALGAGPAVRQPVLELVDAVRELHPRRGTGHVLADGHDPQTCLDRLRRSA